MSVPDETDLYELGVRRKAARTTLMIGIVLLIVAAAFLVGFVALLATGVFMKGLLGLGGVLGFLGGGAFVSGLRARQAARAFEQQLGP